MSLTQRERVFGLSTVTFFLFVFAVIAVVWIVNSFSSRYSDISRLETEIKGRERTFTLARHAASRLADYRQQSLPPDHSDARTAYQAWLVTTAEKHFGEDTSVVGPSESAIKRTFSTPQPGGSDSRGSEVYRQFSYTVSGTGNLKQLTNFLYDFYSINTLHRLRTISVHRIEDSKDLELTFVVEALSLPDATERSTINTEPSERLRFADNKLEDYAKAILDRNLFAPPNHPPQISVSPKSATTKRSYSLEIHATDKDELDKLTFSLGEAPTGAKMSRAGDKSARITWTPQEPGDYRFSVSVTDDGWPSRSDSTTFTVAVSNPRPIVPIPPRPPTPTAEKPRFDVAKVTVLIAVLVGRDGQATIWLEEKPTGQIHKKKVGEDFKVGSVAGVIKEIGSQHFVFQSGDKVKRLGKGEILANAQDDVLSTSGG